MGFLKKFFSIGNKKSKKHSLPIHQPKQQQPLEEDTEAAVSRLLRSSSARFGVESGLNYASLPPLPHPINSVLPNPAVSTATISSTSQRSTYTVTVHGRTVHSRTEFPNAYPPMDSLATPKRNTNDSARLRSKSVPVTPRDQNRLLRLRQDPSVASLLNIYDENGCLDSHVFSNTPPVTGKKARLPRHSTGSTFRQLLGHPSNSELRNNSDIEWAENFLDETDDNSFTCSSNLKTPCNPHLLSPRFDHSITLSTECDTLQNQYTFSSLEVELSPSSEVTRRVHVNSPYDNPMIPQRASQVFGFLADKKMISEERPSRLPTRKITPPSRTLFDLASTNAQLPNITHLCDTQPPDSSTEMASQPMLPPSQSVPTGRVELLHPTAHEELEPLTIDHTGQSSRGPRGPRAVTKIPSRSKSDPAQLQDSPPPVPEINVQDNSCRPAFGEKSNADDRYPAFVTVIGENGVTSIPPYISRQTPRSKVVHLNGDSQLPTLARNSSLPHFFTSSPSLAKNKFKVKSPSTADAPLHDKENDVTSRPPQPKTPIRPFGFRPPHIRDQPSPASSCDLSPVGKQMMSNLRQQRMQARQKERQTGRLGSSHSRVRY